jgi:hypothetical protein
MPRPPQWFEIPAGTRETTCRGCDEPGFWIKTCNGKNMLVDLQTEGAHAPTETETGQGAGALRRVPTR